MLEHNFGNIGPEYPTGTDRKKESLSSFQKVICDRFIQKYKIENAYLKLVSLSNICTEGLEFATNVSNVQC